MRVVDLQFAFPYIVLAMAIVAATKTSIPILIVLLGLAGWVYFARVVRGVVLQEMQRDYVRSAQVLGASRWRIGLRYVLPNVLPAIAIIATLQLPGLIIFEATLSFLGLGIQPPTPSLGGMMLDGTQYIASAWWVITLPGIAILLVTLSLNIMSDGLRQLLDPEAANRMSEQPQPRLAVRNLTTVFRTRAGRFVAVDDVSFDVLPRRVPWYRWREWQRQERGRVCRSWG